MTIKLVLYTFFFLLGVSVQPSTPNVAVSEDGGTGGSDGGDSGTGTGPQAMVCIELASGSLQRDVSVRLMTISSPTATGILIKQL